MCHILLHKNVNDAFFFSGSNLQVTAFIASRSLQKITNYMVRHLTGPHFQEYHVDAAISPRKRRDLDIKLQKSN